MFIILRPGYYVDVEHSETLLCSLGADVGTTCSYQATFLGFERAGFSPQEAEGLFRRSIQLAAEARDGFWSNHQQQASVDHSSA